MGHYLYDYIVDSFLYQHSDNLWRSYTDAEIKKELERYKGYTQQYQLTLQNKKSINAFAGFSMPSTELIRQTSLYLDKMFIYDPLVTFHSPDDNFSHTMNEFLGFKDSNLVDRERLQGIINYIKDITPFIVYDYVEIIPINDAPDLKKGVNIFASENYFKELLPDDIRDWFHDRVIVNSMTKMESSWRVDNTFKPSRGIYIHFKDDNETRIRVYNLFEQEIVEYNKEARTYKARMRLPETPPDKAYFEAWVEQSVNRTSYEVFRKLYFENYLCAALNNSMYISNSEFANSVLNLQFDPITGTITKAANLALSLDLPVIREISNEDLMSIRNNQDSSFQLFRSSLERKVHELTDLKDIETINKKINEFSYELNETNIRDINVAIKNVKKQLGIESIFITSSLITSIMAAGWGIIPAAISAFQGLRTYDEYRNTVSTNPSFIFWKMKQKIAKRHKRTN